MALKVGVIGAGIAGLSSAIALQRAGHNVEVFEQSVFKSEVGAAITLTTNGALILKEWGFDFDKARAVETKQIRMCTTKELVPIFQDSFKMLETEYGNKLYFFHRADLHAGLRETTESLGVIIHLGSAVNHVDTESGKMTFTGGKWIQKDLIIIADGYKSRFLASITEDPGLFSIGRSAFRCRIPTEDIMQDKELRSIFHDQEAGFWVPTDIASGTFIVTYPCRGGEILNLALLHPTPEDEMDHAENWQTPATPESVLEVIKDLHPAVQRLVRMSPDIKCYTISARDPLSMLFRGKTVVIGDAAHPMAPTHAHGAVLAMEECAALAALLHGASPSTLRTCLEAYNDLMRPHCAVVQMLSNHPAGMDDEVLQKLRELYDGPLPEQALPFSRPYRDFFYNWNVFNEANARLESFKL